MDTRKNIGKADRRIRYLVAATVSSLLFSHTISTTSATGTLAWLFVAVILITALDETSPLYILLGISTRTNTKK